MTTSGTFAFAPSMGDLIMSAYARIQIRRAQLLQEHLEDAQREANLWLVSVANRGPNLWTVDLITTPLVEGTATYAVPPTTIMILDPYVDITTGGDPISRTITPLSRSDYAAMSNKAQRGQPTSFWFDRLIDPSITIWPVPDNGGPYTLRYYRFRQSQDANLQNGENVELPYRILDAFVAGLAHRLARIWQPGVEAQRKADADEAWAIAAAQDTENAPVTIAPRLSSYFR